jgi:hypothetical protein
MKPIGKFNINFDTCILILKTLTPDILWDSCYSIFSFMCMFCKSLFVYFFLVFFFWYFFLLAIVLYVPLLYTNSDYPFGIFTPFLPVLRNVNNFFSVFFTVSFYCYGVVYILEILLLLHTHSEHNLYIPF